MIWLKQLVKFSASVSPVEWRSNIALISQRCCRSKISEYINKLRKEVYDLVAFSTFTVSCNHQLYVVQV